MTIALPHLRPRRVDWSLLLLVLAVLLPPIAAALTLIHLGYWPTNDDALMGLSVRDVWTGHPPVMGPRTTTVTQTGIETHHPGPALAYLMSAPAALLGFGPAGLIAGATLLSCLTCAGIVLVARRIGGLRLALGGVLATYAVEWGLGLQLLVRPFNPYPPVLMLLLLGLLQWRLIQRDYMMLPAYVLLASVMAQSHLSYLPLVLIVAVPMGILGMIRWRRLRGTFWPIPGWRVHRGLWRRPGWWAVVLGLVVWLPAIAELFLYHPNNLEQLMRYAASDQRAGLGAPWQVLRMDMGMVAPVPGGFTTQLGGWTGPWYMRRSIPAAVVGAALVAAVAAGAFGPRRWLGAHPARIRAGTRVALLFAVAVGVETLSLPQLAFTEPWNYLQLWPLTALIWVVLAEWGVSLIAQHGRLVDTGQRRHRRTSYLPAAAVSVLGIVAVARSPVPLDRLAYGTAYPQLVQTIQQELQTRGLDAIDVAITGNNLGTNFEAAPAIGYGLALRGDHIYLPALWHGREDTDFRKLRAAPKSAVRLMIRQVKPGGPEPRDLPPRAERVGGAVPIVDGSTFVAFLAPPAP